MSKKKYHDLIMLKQRAIQHMQQFSIEKINEIRIIITIEIDCTGAVCINFGNNPIQIVTWKTINNFRLAEYIGRSWMIYESVAYCTKYNLKNCFIFHVLVTKLFNLSSSAAKISFSVLVVI